MSTEQLELDLWEDLKRAQQRPEAVPVVQLLEAVEELVAQLPQTERLRVAGEALLHVAELCELRAGVLITEWEESHRDPIVGQGFFTDLVRQTMAVDLTDLMEPTPPRKPRTRRVKSTEAGEGSIVGMVDKAVLLAMVEQLESEAAVEEREQQVLAIAHEENVAAWSRAIAQQLEAEPSCRVRFGAMCQRLGMARVEVWLGVLFGEFELEPDEEFYSDALWVKGTARSTVITQPSRVLNPS